MANENELKISILEDGTVKIESGKVAMPIHAKAEAALKRLQEQLGGEVNIKNLPHSHHDTGVHIHGEQGHQH